MKDHLARKVNWHYVINLAGQAYPLRTPEEMIDILRIYNGTNDIEGIHRRRFFNRYIKVGSDSVTSEVSVCADVSTEK